MKRILFLVYAKIKLKTKIYYLPKINKKIVVVAVNYVNVKACSRIVRWLI